MKMLERLSRARMHVFMFDDLVRLIKSFRLPMFFSGSTSIFYVYDAMASWCSRTDIYESFGGAGACA